MMVVKFVSARLGLAFFIAAFALPTFATDVTTSAISDVEIDDIRSTNATVVARNRALMASDLNGRIASVSVDVGDRVKRGDVLLKLDTTLSDLAVRRASANLGAATAELAQLQARLERTRSLAERKYASEDELEELEAQVAVRKEQRQQRQVDLTEARETLALAKLIAPFDGVVEARTAQLGGYALRGNTLMTLTELAGREVTASLVPADVNSLKSSSHVYFETDDGEQFELQLARTTNVLDPLSRQQTVRLTFVAASAMIGESGQLIWRAQRRLLPSNLLVRRNNQMGVFLSEDGRAKFVVIDDAAEGQPSAHSLPTDSDIIVDGRLRLNDGDEITVQQP